MLVCEVDTSFARDMKSSRYTSGLCVMERVISHRNSHCDACLRRLVHRMTNRRDGFLVLWSQNVFRTKIHLGFF